MDGPILIAGPCMAESPAIVEVCADAVAAVARAHPGWHVIFKSSFDKANRSSGRSPRGPGLGEGLRLLGIAKERSGLPVTTDVHEPYQAAACAEICDVLQVPAFLCRQSDLLEACAHTGRIVNVKKGQFLAPQDATAIVDKLRRAGAHTIWLTERGTTFGYQNLVVDMRAFPIMRETGCPVIMDATHATQLPGAAGTHSGGQRQYVETLALAAIASGASGLFIETHPDPAKALSDAATQIPLNAFPALIERCAHLWHAVQGIA